MSNVLTDEEKKALIDQYSFGRDINAFALVAEVERAVLAKAGEQKADLYIVYNGVCISGLYYDAESAKSYADSKQKEHSLSGSIASFHVKEMYCRPLPAQAIPEWQPIETMPFNTPVLVSDEKIIASMFFYKRKDNGYEHLTYPQFMGAGNAEVRVSLHKNGCYSKLKWWRPMMDIPLSASPKPPAD